MTPAGHGGIAGTTFDSDGHRLAGVVYLARGDVPKPTALLLHGCPGLEQNLDLAAVLRDRGWNSLVFHYRGCWGSAGRYDLRTVDRDVRAAVDHLEAGEYPSVDTGRLAVVGHSLGGWAAILAAAADRRLRAVVTCGAPARFDGIEITADSVDREFTRFLATTPAEFLSQRAELALRAGPLDLVASIAPRPLLVVHGGDDEWVRADHGRALYQRARRPRQYVEMEGANHAFAFHRAALRDLIGDWLDETGVLGAAGLAGNGRGLAREERGGRSGAGPGTPGGGRRRGRDRRRLGAALSADGPGRRRVRPGAAGPP
jgi:dipeptidyl aminopeptidase/acylaminoacyl peptidase